MIHGIADQCCRPVAGRKPLDLTVYRERNSVFGDCECMKVYKFMASNYIEAFVRRGTIKIGTAAEYRVPDGFDDGRSDATEMWRLFKRPYKDVRIGDVPALKALFSKDGTADHIIMRIEDDINFLGNAYMFCTSHKITRLMVDKMSSLFGADGCVVISDVRSTS
jgi:hypothetical protein